MKEVKMPFLPEFEARILAGDKFLTTRTRLVAQPGDTFSAFGKLFEILKVYILPLGDVAEYYYSGEGFGVPQEFINCWIRLHPSKGFNPDQEVFTHHFGRVRG